ncbi:hypothetical protein V8C44DRAFT_336684 [Trichoderma aethiopicum]
MQWHYPTPYSRVSNQFRHVLDPSNPSLRCQLTKIGSPPTVSTSDMIPIREPAQNPD